MGSSGGSLHESRRRGPMYFVAICRDRADGLEIRLANRPAHLEFLTSQAERIKVGGPFLTPDGERMIGSVLILEARDGAEAWAILAEDPYGRAGLFQSVELLPWCWVVNPPEPPPS